MTNISNKKYFKMGAEESYPDSYDVIKKFIQLIKYIKNMELVNKPIEKSLKIFKKLSQTFFESYDIVKGKLNDITPYFDKIEKATDSFQKCAEDIIKNRHLDETKAIKTQFQKDFVKFIKQLSNLAEISNKILEKLKFTSPPKTMKRFYMELSIFDFALNVKSTEKPPYYQMSTLPAYSLHEEVLTCKSKGLNIFGPHGTGKTTLVPMFLACWSLSSTFKSKFIIIIENNSYLVHGIERCYKIIKKDKAIPNHKDDDDVDLVFGTTGGDDDGEAEDDNDDDDWMIVTSSLQNVIELAKSKFTIASVIAILSPIEALKLFSEIKNFTQKATFVVDDVNQRLIETDVLVQNISRSIDRLDESSKKAKIVMMSSISDSSFARFIGHCEDLEINVSKKYDVPQKSISCHSIEEIGKISMLKQMRNLFDNWIEEEKYDIGSVIVFVPNVKVGRRIIKGIFRTYNKEDSLNVVPLRTKIRKGENLEDFNERLLGDIETAAVERAEDPEEAAKAGTDSEKILFLLPMDMTGNITDEEKSFIESQLPLPFIKKKFVRLIITSEKNERYMNVPDLSVIFDSGLTETEYYDIQKNVSYYKEELLPKPFIEQRHNLLGDCENGIHFVFNVKNNTRPSKLIPAVKRSNMAQSAFRLRGIDIKLEEQRNLPNEPNHTILDASIQFLKDIGLIDPGSGELTETGKAASQFSSVSPIFALATSKFTDKPEFAFLTSLIIERSVVLVEDSQSPLLCEHFCKDSDVVTILDTILALNINGDGNIIDENAVDYSESGISYGSLYSIYNTMANAFKKSDTNEGRQAVIESIQWAKSQAGGLIAMVDKYVNLLHKEKFLDLRKGTFVHVVGAGPGLEPTLIFKSNPLYKFEKDKDEANSIVKFSQRPGWNGLQVPGNIVILNFQMEESSQLNRGLLIHRDPSKIDENPGVVAIEVANPSVKSYFFISLFEAYWNNQPTVNDFIGIYHSRKPEKQNQFLIHVTENNKKIYLNYCPKTKEIREVMNTAIPLISSLMPFVPRSIVVKSEVPLCAIEVFAYATSQFFVPNIYLIGTPDQKYPLAYSINRQTLEYAAARVDKLRQTMAPIRFAITGEGLYYKFVHGRQIETTLDYPDVDPSIKSVFDPTHTSHMVLLVDPDFADKPGFAQIPWLPPAGTPGATLIASNEEAEFKLMIDVASKVLNGLGYAEKSDDLFFVTLDGAYPIAEQGEIPEFLKNVVGYSASEGGAIKEGVHQIVKQFTKNFTKTQDLMTKIPLKLIGSTNKCTKYTNEASQTSILNQIKNTLRTNFGLGDDDVDAIFLGNSMIYIRMSKLPSNITEHPHSTDIWDDSYQPCQADNTITNLLRGLSVPVTSITHEPSVSMCIQHCRRLGVTREEFEERVKSIVDDFGFLVYSADKYNEGGHDADSIKRGILGEVFIDLIGTSSSIAFASRIIEKFPIRAGLDCDGGMTMTHTMATMTTIRAHADLDPTAPRMPNIGPVQCAYRVPQSEVKALQEIVDLHARDNTKTRWKYDEKYRVLIIPIDDEKEARKKMRMVRSHKAEVACLYMCASEPQEYLPQALYATDKDGTVTPYAICKECVEYFLSSMDDIKFVLDPVTHLIDQNKLKEVTEIPEGFGFVDSNEDETHEYWPQIPLGQLVWALMGDPNDVIPLYVKTWFTIIIEFTIRSSKNFFTYCPDHNDVPLMVPKKGISIKCPHCDYMYCGECQSWHRMTQPCTKIDPSIKRCPRCRVPTVKVSGCNRITCPCGCSWCYKCDVDPPPGFNTTTECYAHLQAAHGGYWD